MDISHEQCFHFMSLKDADLFDKSGVCLSIPCSAYFMAWAIAKVGNLLQFAIPVITSTGGLGDKTSLQLSDHIQRLNNIPKCSPRSQPSPTNPKCSSVQRNMSDLDGEQTSQPPPCLLTLQLPLSARMGTKKGLHTSLPGTLHSPSPSALTAIMRFLLLHFLMECSWRSSHVHLCNSCMQVLRKH